MDDYDQEEQEIVTAFEAGKLKSTQPSHELLERHRSYAKRTMSNDKRVNSRLSEKDLEDIKIRAMEDGIPYPTLMGRILHKNVSGRRVEKSSA